MTMTPLKAERLRRPGLTQLEVSAKVKIENSRYSRLERGQRRATPQEAERIAKYFEYAVSEMMVLYPERYTHHLLAEAS